MMASTGATALAGVPGITLDVIEARALLQTRVDRKYLVAEEFVVEVLEDLSPALRQLEIDSLRMFRYETTYFDTADFATYHASARRRPRRFKVRTRAYLDSGRCSLEVKTRGRRGYTHKHRRAYEIECRGRLTTEGLDFVHAIPESAQLGLHLEAMLTTRYLRRTFLISQTMSRLTVDTDLEWSTPDGRSVALPGLALVESKTLKRSSPADRALWASGCRPLSFSKYCTGLAALHPELPSNKWNRVLRRHFSQ